jgi:hypothetical protein
MAKIIFNKAVVLITRDGRSLFGTVTTEDDKVYLFHNESSSDDIYFRLEKDNSGKWHFAGGPDNEPPSEFIEQIGRQIDKA